MERYDYKVLTPGGKAAAEKAALIARQPDGENGTKAVLPDD